MTDTGSQQKPPEEESEGVAVAEAPAPEPEPWTARRVFEWNSYYDLYVAAFVVLLAFLGSANKIPPNNSEVWSLLQAGRRIASTGSPTVAESTSIAAEGRRWVNIPWLYELSHYALFEGVASLAPRPDPGATVSKVSAPREQYGAGALIAVDSLARGLAAFLLLGLRRKGPGLWWTALCVATALGVTLDPATIESVTPTAGGEVLRSIRPWVGVQIGGIAAPSSVVSPETFGLLFLAIELLILHRAIDLGRPGRLYGLVPLFLVWANSDETFSFGLVTLAAWAIGLTLAARRDRSRPPARPAWIALGLCFGATFVNPSHALGVLAAFGSIARSLGIAVGPPTAAPSFLFGAGLAPPDLAGVARSLRIYYAVAVGLGLASFALNRRDFSLGRLLAFVAASALWALAFNVYTPAFAVVLAATLALNGQEWYLRTLGPEGRLGAGWTVWSTGGRLVTIALVFAAIARGVTGWAGQVGDPQFGFGFNADDFPFESAQAIREAPIEGNILNTSLAQGDAVAWKAGPARKPFLDSRRHLYPRSIFEEWAQLRVALREDAVDQWRPILDRYKISAVMIQLIGDQRDNAPRTYTKLMASPNWIPFYDDGAVVMFGRADAGAPAADLAYFQAHRLDADVLVYRHPQLIAPWERPPTPTWELVDSIFQNRLLNRPQPHTSAALRWLSPANLTPGKPFLADPARCLMAVREARAALSIKPDDSTAFQVLIDAYQRLLAQESALIAGIEPTPENFNKIVQAPSQARYIANRNRQLLAAMNFRLATLAPSKTPDDQSVKAGLNYALAQLYLQGNSLDLAREKLRLVAEEAQTSGMNDEFLKTLTKNLVDLNQRVEQVQTQMQDMTINRRASPIEKANFARSNGTPGLAIHELEEANDAGGNIPGVRPMLVDLYCDAGLPDKAFEVIFNLAADDATLSTGVGTASYRQGLVYFLLGNSANTVPLWLDKAINPIRTQRSLQAPMAAQILLGGDPVASTKMLLELPEKVNLQAEWEFEMAMVGLEGGFPPDFVADHFQAALKLEPNLTVRPLIAYYLEKLGKAVPPPKPPASKSADPSTPDPAPSATPAPAPVPATAPASDKLEPPAIPTAPEPPKP